MPQRYQAMGRYRGKILITRYQASREPYDVTSAQLSIVVWKMSASEERFVGVSDGETDSFVENMKNPNTKKLILFFLIQCWNMWNRLMHALFNIRTVIIPRPISTLGVKPSGRYRFLGMITVLILKRACINLWVIHEITNAQLADNI